MKVGFFLLHFPVFSETFVSKELLTLQQLKVDGVIVCEKQNLSPPVHPHIKNIKFPIIEISQKIIDYHLIKTLSAHFYWLVHHPIGYLKSIYIFLNFFNYHHLRVFIKTPLLAKQLISQQLDLIYVHEVDSPSLYGLICSRLLNLPCGIIFHTQYLFAQNIYLKTKIYFADFTVFQSIYSQKVALRPPHSYVLTTPGIDTDFFKPNVIKSFPKQIKLLTIGRLVEAKGYIYLLKAIKILTKTHPSILLTIVGDGPLKTQFDEYITTNHLQKNIKLLGFRSQDQKFIKLVRQHQYFILPSVTDSQGVHDVHPNVVKEAMSCGLITITSNLGGITEIISNNHNGYLINTITPPKIANIITMVHQLPRSKKINISQNARETILKQHQQRLICQQLKNVFKKFL